MRVSLLPPVCVCKPREVNAIHHQKTVQRSNAVPSLPHWLSPEIVLW